MCSTVKIVVVTHITVKEKMVRLVLVFFPAWHLSLMSSLTAFQLARHHSVALAGPLERSAL